MYHPNDLILVVFFDSDVNHFAVALTVEIEWTMINIANTLHSILTIKSRNSIHVGSCFDNLHIPRNDNVSSAENYRSQFFSVWEEQSTLFIRHYPPWATAAFQSLATIASLKCCSVSPVAQFLVSPPPSITLIVAYHCGVTECSLVRFCDCH